MSRRYAQAAKRVGLQAGVPVVDLYSRFLLTEGWEELFRPEGDRHPSYLLYPNRIGQELIGREIYAAVMENYHRELSAGNRKAALTRAARPEGQKRGR